MTFYALIFLAGLWAGIQNSLAGGGSFVTLPTLIFSGLTPLAANITSTVALFSSQISSGWAGRQLVTGTSTVSFRALFIVSLLGGVVGALLLLNTPSSMFTKLVPWLVLFATSLFAWGSFFRKTPEHPTQVSAPLTLFMQFLIAIYGGYFGGGIGFLMIAALTIAGVPTRNAGATKNVLAGVMNAAAVLLFVFSPEVSWIPAGFMAVGAALGGFAGAWALHRVNEKVLRLAIVGLGLALTVGLFLFPVH